jgi:hypothetical protein
MTFTTAVLADGTITRTPWEQHDGFETVGFSFTCTPSFHGDPCEYQDSSIPPEGDAGWGPAPNGDTIGFGSGSASKLSACWTGDFTYFQTFVEVPENTVVTEFTIEFSGMDDGSRVSICNADNPGCAYVPGSDVYLGGSGTTDLSDLVIEGSNRVVITQVDDCPTGNNLHYAGVVINGDLVNVPTDDDGDGVNNPDDACPNTNLEDAVSVFGVNSGVENFVFGNGCSLSDIVTAELAECADSGNHGKFVSCTAHRLNGLRAANVITNKEKGALQSAAGQSDVGKPASSSNGNAKGKNK